MSNNEIVKVNFNNSLLKVGNVISLTNKLLYGLNKNGIVLYDISSYKLQQKTEIAFINFIKKNIWIFLPMIIDQIKNNQLSSDSYPINFISNIEQNDLSYEYPRSFYRTRGKGTSLVDTEYDRKIKKNNGEYILCSPPINNSFKIIVSQNITSFVAGHILTAYAETSIGSILGIQYRWAHIDNTNTRV